MDGLAIYRTEMGMQFDKSADAWVPVKRPEHTLENIFLVAFDIDLEARNWRVALLKKQRVNAPLGDPEFPCEKGRVLVASDEWNSSIRLERNREVQDSAIGLAAGDIDGLAADAGIESEVIFQVEKIERLRLECHRLNSRQVTQSQRKHS